MDIEIDNAKLMFGDCLERMKEIPSGSVDLTVTSPPYDNIRSYNGNNDQWSESVWRDVIKDLYRVTSDGGVVVWVVGDATIKGSETGTSFKQALYAMSCGFNLHDTMIYNKNTIPKNHNRYEQDFEYMFVFSKGKPKTFTPIRVSCIYKGQDKSKRTMRQDGDELTSRSGKGVVKDDKIKGNIWRMISDGNKTNHPAVFPLQLALDHVLSWCSEGDTVFDPFMGSGTTGVACVNTGRKFIGIELDSTYYGVACGRVLTTAP